MKTLDDHGRRRAGASPPGSSYSATLLLLAVLALTVGPFLWQLSTSLKGPHEDIFSSPPTFLPGEPTLDNYTRVARHHPGLGLRAELAEGRRRQCA